MNSESYFLHLDPQQLEQLKEQKKKKNEKEKIVFCSETNSRKNKGKNVQKK